MKNFLLIILVYNGFIDSLHGNNINHHIRKPEDIEAIKKRKEEREKTRNAKRRLYQKKIEKEQKVVILKNKKYKGKIIDLLNKNQILIITSGRSFLVIRPSSELKINDYLKFIRKLKKQKEIKRIENDRVVHLQQNTSHENEIETLQEEGEEDQNDPIIPCPTNGGVIPIVVDESVTKDMEEIVENVNGYPLSDKQFAKCKLNPHCNSRNPKWAAMQIGADFADKIVDKHLNSYGSQEEKAKIASTLAVVDTGFDTSVGIDENGIPLSLDAFSVSIEKAHEYTGDPENDQGGHGSPVAGVIAGKGIGVSKNLNLNLYRITNPGDGSSVSFGVLDAAIEKACQKADIVNVSWGSQADEIWDTDLTKEKWYELAVEKGCIVVKSAGNRGVREKYKEISYAIDEPYMTVAATNEFQELEGFSTKGMSAAPGGGVYATLSSKHEYSSRTSDNACNMNNQTMGPINGTSFASPILAAVLGQIQTILNARNLLPKDPKEKVILTKSIEMAAKKWNEMAGGGAVTNALGAAIIAENIDSDNMTKNINSLISIGKNAVRERCAKSHKNCRESANCRNVRSCVNEQRFKSLVCVPPDKNTHRDLLLTSYALSEDELTNSLLMKNSRTGEEGDVESNDYIISILNDKWDKITSESIDIDKTSHILIAAKNMGYDEFADKEKIKTVIDSIDFKITFHIKSEYGDEILYGSEDATQFNFTSSFKTLSPEDQIDLINELPNINRYGTEAEWGLLYGLYFQQHTLDKNVKDTLKEKIKSLAKEWKSGRLKLEIAGKKHYFTDDDILKYHPVVGMLNSSLNDWTPPNPIFDFTGLTSLPDPIEYDSSGNLESYRSIINQDINQYEKAIASILNKYNDLHKDIQNETDQDKKNDKSDQLDMADKLLSNMTKNLRNDMDAQNKILRNLLRDGTREDVEEAKKHLLNSPYARLPTASSSYGKYNSDSNQMKTELISDQKFLNDFLRSKLSVANEKIDVPLHERPRSSYEWMQKKGNEFHRLKKQASSGSILQLIGDMEFFDEKNMKEALQNNQEQFEVFISNIANDNVQYGDNKAQNDLDYILRNHKRMERMGMGDVLRKNLHRVRSDMINNPKKYPDYIQRDIKQLYGMKE